jgi:hypothetical protein
MVERHYNAVAVSPRNCARQETFALLSAPAMDASQAARVIAQAVRIESIMPVRRTPASEIARHGLAGMAYRLAVWITSQLVSRMADEELALLLTDLHAVRKACVQFRERQDRSGEFS